MIQTIDCLQGLRSLKEESVDLILTDPPYSSGARREAGKSVRANSRMTRNSSTEWFGTDSLSTNGFTWLMRECAVEWHRVLKDGGHALVFIDWRMASALSGAIESADLKQNGVLVWDKTHFGMGSYFRNQYELILHFSKGKGNEPQRRDVGNVISCKPVRDGTHPTEKPVELLKTLISVVTPKAGKIVDCFSGTGSTGVAAVELGREFEGFEREKKYANEGNRRIQDAMVRFQAFGNFAGTAAS